MPLLGSLLDQPSQPLTEALCRRGDPVLGTMPKAGLALGVCHAWPEAEGTGPAAPALLQLFKTTNRPSAILSAAGLDRRLLMPLQHNYR